MANPVPVGADRHEPAAGQMIELIADVTPRELRVQLELPAGLKAWPGVPSVWIDAGPKGDSVKIPETKFQNGELVACAGLGRLGTHAAAREICARPRVRHNRRFARRRGTMDRQARKSRPVIVGWEVVAPEGGFAGDTVCRLTPPGSAEPVILVYDSEECRLLLPERLTWEMVTGGALRSALRGRRPLLFPAVDSPRLDGTIASQRPRAEAAGRGPGLPIPRVDRTIPKDDVRPLAVVINDPGRVAAESADAEDRIRQAQTDVVRNLVECARRAHWDLRTFAGWPRRGDWPPGKAAELLDAGTEIPFAKARRYRRVERSARTLRQILQTPGAGDLSDQLVVIVVTPYGARTDDTSGSSRWLDVTLKQLQPAIDVPARWSSVPLATLRTQARPR